MNLVDYNQSGNLDALCEYDYQKFYNDYYSNHSNMASSMLNFTDFERSTSLDDSRALKLAFELSLLNMSDQFNFGVHSPIHQSVDVMDYQTPTFDYSKFASNLNAQLGPLMDDNKQKKSQNMTECVPVPSSEHVAEIVGRQGCKIKALRAKTNTYIKTPVRGEEPVFVVTGRKEDVSKAKIEILSAAEHFSQIRASRKNLSGLSSGRSTPHGSLNGSSGHVTVHVRVPYRVVGLVVGPKGATIKRIQQQTHTYIVTPSRDKEPIFEVTGLPENVHTARKEIESHIAVRTNNGTLINSSADLNAEDVRLSLEQSELFQSLCRNTHTIEPLLNMTHGNSPNNSEVESPIEHNSRSSIGSTTSGIYSSLSPCSSSSNSSINGSNNINNPSKNSSSLYNGLSDLISSWNSSLKSDDSLLGPTAKTTPTTSTAPFTSDIWSFSNRSSSAYQSQFQSQSQYQPQSQSQSQLQRHNCLSTSTNVINRISTKSKCFLCDDRVVEVAFVPCGHNMFCLQCANQVCNSKEAVCPICQQPARHFLRIIA